MQDSPSSSVALDASGGNSEYLNPPDVERILGDFRAWLEALRAFDPTAGIAAADEAPQVDLATLVGQFVALKQEVNLQTRASRGQMEQTTQSLEELRQSLALLERQHDSLETGHDEAVRPLLKSVLDAHDVLALARREVQKIHDTLQQLIERYGSPAKVAALSWDESQQADDAFAKNGTPWHDESSEPWREPGASNVASVDCSAPPAIKVSLPWWARLLGLEKKVDDALVPYHTWRAQQNSILKSALERDQDTLRHQVAALAQEAETRKQRLAAQAREIEARKQHLADLAQQQEARRQKLAALAQEQEMRQREIAALGQPIIQGVQSILTGYRMSLQRLERAIEQHGLEPIATVGAAFDPEQMEALEIVRDSGRPPGQVVDEIRRGYLWHDKVFRFAQVSVSQ